NCTTAPRIFFFFFQAEDGIRDRNVTGVQTCALPISGGGGGEDNCFMSCLCETPAAHSPPKKRGFFAGCAVALFMCCTCQFCLRDPHPGPWSGKPRGACHHSLHCCECCDTCTQKQIGRAHV